MEVDADCSDVGLAERGGVVEAGEEAGLAGGVCAEQEAFGTEGLGGGVHICGWVINTDGLGGEGNINWKGRSIATDY